MFGKTNYGRKKGKRRFEGEDAKEGGKSPSTRQKAVEGVKKKRLKKKDQKGTQQRFWRKWGKKGKVWGKSSGGVGVPGSRVKKVKFLWGEGHLSFGKRGRVT